MKPDMRSRVALQWLLLITFGGIGSLMPFLPSHMLEVGLTVYQAFVVSIVAPLVALVGPLVLCPIADRLGGQALRVMLAITLILAAICYSLLMIIPVVKPASDRSSVNFSCNSKGAAVYQEQCGNTPCHDWSDEEVTRLTLVNCHLDCNSTPDQDDPNTDFIIGKNSTVDEEATTEISTSTFIDIEPEFYPDISEVKDDDEVDKENHEQQEDEETSRKRKRDAELLAPELPHICSKDITGHSECHVYSENSEVILNVSILSPQAKRGWCRYQLAGEFSCRFPGRLLEPSGHNSCHVICEVKPPFTTVGLCEGNGGDPDVTFWSYLVVRSIADIFLAASIGLINSVIIVAARDGGVGRYLMWAGLGLAIFAPIIGSLLTAFSTVPIIFPAFIVFDVLLLCAAVLIITVKSLPLIRPEWWAVPIGKLSKHGLELGVFGAILILLGTLSGAVDSYLPWYLENLEGTKFLYGLTLSAGILPALPLLWYSESVVDYCGHANVLITAFTFYIIRYTVLFTFDDPWWAVLCEVIQVFSLCMMWATVILYMRQLVPRHLTATAQGGAIILHFCLGRSLGALFGAILSSNVGGVMAIHWWGATLAAVIASLYFILYHCLLKMCTNNSGNRDNRRSGVLQGPTTNGTYAPLRVYNSSEAKQKNAY